MSRSGWEFHSVCDHLETEWYILISMIVKNCGYIQYLSVSSIKMSQHLYAIEFDNMQWVLLIFKVFDWFVKKLVWLISGRACQRCWVHLLEPIFFSYLSSVSIWVWCVDSKTYGLKLIDSDDFAAPVWPDVNRFGKEHRVSPVTGLLLDRDYRPQIDIPIYPIFLREI